MIDFIVKYWIEFLFGLIISGMGVMAKLMYNQHLKNKAIDKGVEALLRNGIVQTYNKWSERGYCPIYARENATRMYEPYHILGGNDVATDLIEDLKGLPTEPQKKKEGVEDDPYIVFLCSLMDRHGPGGGCIKHNRQRNRSSIGGLPWNKYDYEHL